MPTSRKTKGASPFAYSPPFAFPPLWGVNLFSKIGGPGQIAKEQKAKKKYPRRGKQKGLLFPHRGLEGQAKGGE